MKKIKDNYILTKDEFIVIYHSVINYATLFDYMKHKILTGELMSTPQVIAQYYITRQTLYRIIDRGLLKPVFKYRTYYFDADDIKKFFQNYRSAQKVPLRKTKHD
ncbi:helix-turn-helix domain-containing protein [Pedobacter chitinilyticus]|uniref:DNA-binding protein n=1 Tax=Pedobacter chitinilyticus TaxID=2233776 RepID=A0A3S3SUD3_9SPHI|nr:helix-turn-helix domain-containing protein [Pedobacter chitinilyticus]RWU10572.1 DNA-binding protein [Pedobacter chitinilyticus]